MAKKGDKVSDESKKRMSEAQKKRFENDSIWNKNLYWPDSVRENISKGMKKYWQDMTPEQRERMCERLDRIRPVSGNGNNKQ
jgi:hypothetical protein